MQRRHNKSRVGLLLALASIRIAMNANAEPHLVDIQTVDPTIIVDLRYAGNNNFLRHPLYRQGMRARIRPEVAAALSKAQKTLRQFQYGLKIWDAYRPASVQTKLWERS